MEPNDLTQSARCWCGDTVTIADSGFARCGTDLAHDPCLPPLAIPIEDVAKTLEKALLELRRLRQTLKDVRRDD